MTYLFLRGFRGLGLLVWVLSKMWSAGQLSAPVVFEGFGASFFRIRGSSFSSLEPRASGVGSVVSLWVGYFFWNFFRRVGEDVSSDPCFGTFYALVGRRFSSVG